LKCQTKECSLEAARDSFNDVIIIQTGQNIKQINGTWLSRFFRLPPPRSGTHCRTVSSP